MLHGVKTCSLTCPCLEYFNPFPLTTFTFKVSQTLSPFDVRSERAKAGWAAGPGGEDDGRRRFLFVDIGGL